MNAQKSFMLMALAMAQGYSDLMNGFKSFYSCQSGPIFIPKKNQKIKHKKRNKRK